MRRAVILATLVAFGLAVSGCATPRPGVFAYPQKGQTAERAARDDFECQAWAQQQTGFSPAASTAEGAGLGALVGGLIGAAGGAAIGAATGSPGTGAAIGAAAGGLGGAGVGAGLGYTKSREAYDRAYAACMKARGYVVN